MARKSVNDRDCVWMIKAVFFDLGGTLLDETRFYEVWASWLRSDTKEFLAELEALAAEGKDHRLLFERFSPDSDLDSLIRRREDAGDPPRFLPEDLYPDARSCLDQLKAAGYIVGVAGNQGMFKDDLAKAVGLDVDVSRAGDLWEFEKPDVRFFERLVAEAECSAGEVVYVGDRVDNDIVPAKEVGLRTILVTTGPWGRAHAKWPQAQQADAIVDSLTEVPDVIESWNRT